MGMVICEGDTVRTSRDPYRKFGEGEFGVQFLALVGGLECEVALEGVVNRTLKGVDSTAARVAIGIHGVWCLVFRM